MFTCVFVETWPRETDGAFERLILIVHSEYYNIIGVRPLVILILVRSGYESVLFRWPQMNSE